MKLTSKQLKRIIKEELNKIMNEAYGGMMPSSVLGGEEAPISKTDRAYALAEPTVEQYTKNFPNLAPFPPDLLEKVVEGVLWYFKEEGRDPTEDEIEEMVDTIARY
tara:strand:+ start:110 stop:427 length:318 start_codon:yes stop_codon:yes gene_type:complete